MIGGEKDARTTEKIGFERKSEDPHAQCIVGGHEFHEEPISLLSQMKQGFVFNLGVRTWPRTKSTWMPWPQIMR